MLHPLTIEKISADNPLTNENLNAGYVATRTRVSPQEMAASCYERVRNLLAVSMGEFSDETFFSTLALTHGKTFREMDKNNADECATFITLCENTEALVHAHVGFLREKRWYNS